jgi:hypothetical protein
MRIAALLTLIGAACGTAPNWAGDAFGVWRMSGIRSTRQCSSGERTRIVRRLSARSKELVLEIIEQQRDGRRFERRLVLEKQ